MKAKKKILLPVLGAFLLMLYSFCYGFGYVPYFLTNSQKEEIMQGYLDTHSYGEKWFYTADIVNVSRKITRPDEVLLSVYLHEDTYQIKDGKIWNGGGGEDILLIHAKLTDSGMEYLNYKSPREGGLLYEDITRIFCPVSVIGWMRLESRASHLFQLHDNNSQQAEEYYQLPYTGKFYHS